MDNYCTRMLVYDIISRDFLQRELKSGSNTDHVEVLGSTHEMHPNALFSVTADSRRGRRGAIANHYAWKARASEGEVGKALLETVDSFKLENVIGRDALSDGLYHLVSEKRNSQEAIYWGSVSLEIPVNCGTRNLRQLFRKLGYQHLIIVRNDGVYAIVTAQCGEKELLEDIAVQVSSIVRIHKFELTSRNFKGERLCYYTVTSGVQPPPVVVGMERIEFEQ